MPHLSIEYSPGLETHADVTGLCRDLHAVMLATDIFPTAGIRIRTHKADFAIIADGHEDNDFVAMTLNVGAGRSEAQLKEAGDALFATAQAALNEPLSRPHFALSLEIRVINPALSWKDTPIHARLSGKS